MSSEMQASSSSSNFSPKGVKRSGGRSSSPIRSKTSQARRVDGDQRQQELPPTKMDWVQTNILPYVCVAWAITGAIIMIPNFCEGQFTFAVLSYTNIASLFFILSFCVMYFTYIVVSRGWTKLFKDRMFDVAKWIWSELKQLGDSFVAKLVLGILLSLLAILSSIWIKHHLDLLYILTTIKQFAIAVWEVFFDIPRLVKVIRDWTDKIALNWVIKILSMIIATSQAYIAEHAVGGLVLIGAFTGITVGVLLVAKHMNEVTKLVRYLYTGKSRKEPPMLYKYFFLSSAATPVPAADDNDGDNH